MAQKLRISALNVQPELSWVDDDGELSPGPSIDPFKIGLKGLAPELVEQLKKQVLEFGEQQLAAAQNQPVGGASAANEPIEPTEILPPASAGPYRN